MAHARAWPGYATDEVMVATYTPGAKLAGKITEIIGSQLAVLTPVLAPVTTVETPVRSDALTAVATTVAESVMAPAA